jgi:hypothetical protein
VVREITAFDRVELLEPTDDAPAGFCADVSAQKPQRAASLEVADTLQRIDALERVAPSSPYTWAVSTPLRMGAVTVVIRARSPLRACEPVNGRLIER